MTSWHAGLRIGSLHLQHWRLLDVRCLLRSTPSIELGSRLIIKTLFKQNAVKWLFKRFLITGIHAGAKARYSRQDKADICEAKRSSAGHRLAAKGFEADRPFPWIFDKTHPQHCRQGDCPAHPPWRCQVALLALFCSLADSHCF